MTSIINLKENLVDINDPILSQKMIFIFNALENGWEVKKSENAYIFRQKHNNKKEVFEDNYLEEFIVKNMKI